MKRHGLVPAVVFFGCARRCLVACPAVRSRTGHVAIRLDGVAPEVAAAVQAAHEPRANAGGSSAADWLTLGMVCEANGLTGDARRAYEQAVAARSCHCRVRGTAWRWLEAAPARSRTRSPQSTAPSPSTARTRPRSGAADCGCSTAGTMMPRAPRSRRRRRSTRPIPADGSASPVSRFISEQPAQAVEVLERFLSQHPGDRYAMRLLGTAYQRLGRDRRCRVCAGPRRDRRAELARSVERRAGAVSRRLRAESQGGDRADPERPVRRRHPDARKTQSRAARRSVADAPAGPQLRRRRPRRRRDRAAREGPRVAIRTTSKAPAARVGLSEPPGLRPSARACRARRRARSGTGPRLRNQRHGAVARRTSARRVERVRERAALRSGRT